MYNYKNGPWLKKCSPSVINIDAVIYMVFRISPEAIFLLDCSSYLPKLTGSINQQSLFHLNLTGSINSLLSFPHKLTGLIHFPPFLSFGPLSKFSLNQFTFHFSCQSIHFSTFLSTNALSIFPFIQSTL